MTGQRFTDLYGEPAVREPEAICPACDHGFGISVGEASAFESLDCPGCGARWRANPFGPEARLAIREFADAIQFGDLKLRQWFTQAANAFIERRPTPRHPDAEPEPPPIAEFAGLNHKLGKRIVHLIERLPHFQRGDMLEPLVELSIGAFGVGYEEGQNTPVCGCRVCDQCGNWCENLWCPDCEESLG